MLSAETWVVLDRISQSRTSQVGLDLVFTLHWYVGAGVNFCVHERHAYSTPANTISWPNAVLVLGQRRRRWANTRTALGLRLVLAGTEDHDNWQIDFLTHWTRQLTKRLRPNVIPTSWWLAQRLLMFEMRLCGRVTHFLRAKSSNRIRSVGKFVRACLTLGQFNYLVASYAHRLTVIRRGSKGHWFTSSYMDYTVYLAKLLLNEYV